MSSLVHMFVRVMALSEERRALIEKLLANRKVLRDRNKEEQLLKQDATVAFEQAYKPVLDPVRDTQKAVARVAETGEQTARALETLPPDIAPALPAGKPAAGPPPRLRQNILARFRQLHKNSTLPEGLA